ncbi:hypothetical protein CPB86DRAFT_128015 [Serendipita vermifera]|nr:hypothetical protein CPB86DRAFT_128015 [Serendipita vermifera]
MSENTNKSSPVPPSDLSSDGNNMDIETKIEAIFQRLKAIREEEQTLIQSLNAILLKERQQAEERLQRVENVQRRMKEELDKNIEKTKETVTATLGLAPIYSRPPSLGKNGSNEQNTKKADFLNRPFSIPVPSSVAASSTLQAINPQSKSDSGKAESKTSQTSTSKRKPGPDFTFGVDSTPAFTFPSKTTTPS